MLQFHYIFTIRLGVNNTSWLQMPGFDVLHHKFEILQITNYKGRDKCDRAEVISQYEYRDITSLLVLPKGSNIFLIADTILHQIILKKAGETLKYLYGNESNSLAADKYIGQYIYIL